MRTAPLLVLTTRDRRMGRIVRTDSNRRICSNTTSASEAQVWKERSDEKQRAGTWHPGSVSFSIVLSDRHENSHSKVGKQRQLVGMLKSASRLVIASYRQGFWTHSLIFQITVSEAGFVKDCGTVPIYAGYSWKNSIKNQRYYNTFLDLEKAFSCALHKLISHVTRFATQSE